MSVLIKNMEIPEHCGYCRFRYDGICHALQKTQYSVEECPLVPVNDIKAAQPEQQWIPVSSGKLPENSITLVLVQIGEKCPDVELAFYDYNRECWENARHYQKIPDVVAWMPLPEPWKGGEK